MQGRTAFGGIDDIAGQQSLASLIKSGVAGQREQCLHRLCIKALMARVQRHRSRLPLQGRIACASATDKAAEICAFKTFHMTGKRVSNIHRSGFHSFVATHISTVRPPLPVAASSGPMLNGLRPAPSSQARNKSGSNPRCS